MPKIPKGYTNQLHVKYFFAKNFGWPPTVVDDLSLEEFHWFPLIEVARNEAQEIIQDIVNNRNSR